MATDYPIPTSGLTDTLLANAAGIVAYAQGRVSVVDQFVSGLKDAVLSLQPAPIVPSFPDSPVAPGLQVPTPPTFEAPVWVAPGFPTPFTDKLDLGDLTVQPFDDDPPTINYGAAPPPFDGELPTPPAIQFDFDDPTLQVTLPAPPSLLSLNVEKFGGLNLPTFDATEPVLTAVAPSIREYVPGKQYTSSLLTALKASLEQRITQGGTGLSPDVENAIWDRGREREARSQADAIRQLDQMEELGYSFVPGIYLDARLRVITETDYANRGHSREVMIKAAELELDNVKTALTTATQLEGQLIDYTNATEQRLFDASRYATEAGISIYNAQVQSFAALIEVYKAKVAIYQALVQAEVSKVDAYRAEIAAEQAKAQINQALVDQYKVQIEAALANVDIFKAEIAAIQTKADIEKTKVEIFGAQVQGYTAQINAYTAGIEGFRAQLGAEQTKVQVYTSQVQAFAARVDASARQIEARVKGYEGLITAKTAEYDGYRAAVAGESARVDALAKQSGVVADVYKSQVTGIAAYNDTLVKEWAAAIDQQARIADIGISAAKANAELYINSRSLALEAAKTGATVSAQIGSAALNAFNFSGSVSSSEGYNASLSVSNSQSQSTSSATSTSTNYNYNV